MQSKCALKSPTNSNIFLSMEYTKFSVFTLISLSWIFEFDFNNLALNLKCEKFLNGYGVMFSLNALFLEQNLIDFTCVYNYKDRRYVDCYKWLVVREASVLHAAYVFEFCVLRNVSKTWQLIKYFISYSTWKNEKSF